MTCQYLMTILLLIVMTSPHHVTQATDHAPLSENTQLGKDIASTLKRKSSAVCTVRNDEFNEYIYAHTTGLFDLDLIFDFIYGSNTYLWTPGYIIRGAMWRFTYVHNGGYFTIKNVDYINKYLSIENNTLSLTTDTMMNGNDLHHGKYYVSGSYWNLEPYKTGFEEHGFTKLHIFNKFLGGYPKAYAGIHKRLVGVQNKEFWHDKNRGPIDGWDLNCD